MKRDRKEISALKREVQQLRKLLHQRDQDAVDAKEIIEEDEVRHVEEKRKEVRLKCSKCKGEAELMDLGGRGYYKVCIDRANCWHREKHKQ
jgi:hypothetical protein